MLVINSFSFFTFTQEFAASWEIAETHVVDDKVSSASLAYRFNLSSRHQSSASTRSEFVHCTPFMDVTFALVGSRAVKERYDRRVCVVSMRLRYETRLHG